MNRTHLLPAHTAWTMQDGRHVSDLSTARAVSVRTFVRTFVRTPALPDTAEPLRKSEELRSTRATGVIVPALPIKVLHLLTLSRH